MPDKFTLSVGLAQELEFAFNRTGWTSEEVKRLTAGETLREVRELVFGRTKKEVLLSACDLVCIPATGTKFVAKDRFVENTKKNAPVKISWLGDNFKEWFLGKIEESRGGVLQYWRLLTPSLDAPIIAELGGEAKAETTLTELFSLLEKQKNGESGILLTSGYANVFYIRDAKGVLRTVGAYFRTGRGWRFYASPLEDPCEWPGGRQVFSRNS